MEFSPRLVSIGYIAWERSSDGSYAISLQWSCITILCKTFVTSWHHSQMTSLLPLKLVSYTFTFETLVITVNQKNSWKNDFGNLLVWRVQFCYLPVNMINMFSRTPGVVSIWEWFANKCLSLVGIVQWFSMVYGYIWCMTLSPFPLSIFWRHISFHLATLVSQDQTKSH